jgi:hypothetical protein
MKTGSDTPETDAVREGYRESWRRGKGRSHHDSIWTFSESLERERDTLRNLLSTVLKFGLTDQVKAEARKLLAPKCSSFCHQDEKCTIAENGECDARNC